VFLEVRIPKELVIWQTEQSEQIKVRFSTRKTGVGHPARLLVPRFLVNVAAKGFSYFLSNLEPKLAGIFCKTRRKSGYWSRLSLLGEVSLGWIKK
jgi:hypothetical protein